jgi:hypothetical protein
MESCKEEKEKEGTLMLSMTRIGIWKRPSAFCDGLLCFSFIHDMLLKQKPTMSTNRHRRHDSSLTFCCWNFLNGASLITKWSFQPKGIKVPFFCIFLNWQNNGKNTCKEITGIWENILREFEKTLSAVSWGKILMPPPHLTLANNQSFP